MLSRKFVEWEECWLKDIEHNMYSIRCDFSNKRVLRMRKKIILYNIKRILEYADLNGEFKEDYAQIIKLREFVKKFRVRFDGRYMRGEFPEGYENIYESN